MKKIAVILSGCGYLDGAEIHESVMTLLAIGELGGKYQCFAPDIDQHHVVNHLTGEEMDGDRNVLVESARIARGDIMPLSEYNADDFDAIILPGGFGAAKNLCDFAINGSDCTINGEVDRAIIDSFEKKKVIGAICISPVIIARILDGVELTIGNDHEVACKISEMGGIHKDTSKHGIYVDVENKIVTNAGYMYDVDMVDIYVGVKSLVSKILSL